MKCCLQTDYVAHDECCIFLPAITALPLVVVAFWHAEAYWDTNLEMHASKL